MANSINSISTGSGGLQSIADGTSGNLLIQKDAGTIATFSSTGVVVSGVVAATTLTGDGSALTGISSGGLTLLSTLNTTSGTTVTTGTLDLSTYKELHFSLFNLGLTNNAGGNLKFTPNGGTIVAFSPDLSSNRSMYAICRFDLASGVGFYSCNTPSASSPFDPVVTEAFGGPAGVFVNTTLTTSTTSIGFTSTSGGDWLRGQIKIYGLK